MSTATVIIVIARGMLEHGVVKKSRGRGVGIRTKKLELVTSVASAERA